MGKILCCLIIVVVFLSLQPCLIESQTDRQDERDIPAYRLESNLVAVLVYVTDHDGNPVRGLDAAAFQVFEKGKRMAVKDVEFIDFHDLERRGEASTYPESSRQFLLLFDLSFTDNSGFLAAKRAALKFLEEEAAPNDLIAVATVAGRAGIDLAAPFSTDRARAREAIDRVGLRDVFRYRDSAGFVFEDLLEEAYNQPEKPIESTSGEDSEITLKDVGDIAAIAQLRRSLEASKRADHARYEEDVTNYVYAMMALAEGLGNLRGRKDVLFFSEGFDQKAIAGNMAERRVGRLSSLSGNTSTMGSSALRARFYELMELFRRSGVVFFPIDTRRLAHVSSTPIGREAQGRSRTQYTLYQFADETNGKLYTNLNDLKGVLHVINTRTACGYLVIFEPAETPKPGEFRPLTIKVDRPGIRVQHQKGYSVEKDYRDLSPDQKRIQLAEFIVKDISSRRIPFDFSADVFPHNPETALIPVLLDVEGGTRLVDDERRREPEIRLEIYGYLLDEMNRPMDQFESHMAFGTEEARSKLREGGVRYYGCFLARPGGYRVKCIVRDGELGEISSIVRRIEVPDFAEEGLVLRGPYFIARSAAGGIRAFRTTGEKTQGMRRGSRIAYPFSIGKRELIPAIAPEIDGAEPTYLFTRLYGLGRDPSTNLPRIDLKLEVTGQDGSRHVITACELVDSRDDGTSISMILGLQPNALTLPPGEYSLHLKIMDLASGGEALTPVFQDGKRRFGVGLVREFSLTSYASAPQSNGPTHPPLKSPSHVVGRLSRELMTKRRSSSYSPGDVLPSDTLRLDREASMNIYSVDIETGKARLMSEIQPLDNLGYVAPFYLFKNVESLLMLFGAANYDWTIFEHFIVKLETGK